jgi:hypothetical protein
MVQLPELLGYLYTYLCTYLVYIVPTYLPPGYRTYLVSLPPYCIVSSLSACLLLEGDWRVGLGQLTARSQQLATLEPNPNPLQPVRAQIPGDNVRLNPPSVALFILRPDHHPSLHK